MVYFYMQRDSLCFLTLTEESYPKRLAFLYLEEVADAIMQEMVQEFGNDVSESTQVFVWRVLCLPFLYSDSFLCLAVVCVNH